MNGTVTSLEQLHDISMPPPVSWWPPAPAWFVLFALLLYGLIVVALHWWDHWRANAYRRAALRELPAATSAEAISELLRRTALVIAPKSEVAAQTGTHWPEWLAAHLGESIPQTVRDQLTIGVYGPKSSDVDFRKLRDFAATWIARHQEVSESGR